MKKLNLLAIRIDGGTQARVALNQAVVAEYAEHMKDGDHFPPITVYYDGAEYWLADGFHRYFAVKASGQATIEAEVTPGTQEEAQLFALGANKIRGLSLTFEDKRNIITLMLKHPVWGQWSNSQISKHIGVSKMTVGRVKASLEPQAQAKKPYSKPVKKSMESIGRPKDEEKVQELSDTVNDLHSENQLLKDKIAVGQWDVSDIEKMDAAEVIAELREQVRVLEIDNKALRDSRDLFQTRNVDLMKTVKSLQAKLKK